MGRLKQRRIVQWAFAYAAGAFALYTGLQTIGEPWGVSDAALRWTQGVLLVGFLIAVTLAWYHGEKGRQRVSGPELLIIGGLLLVSGLLARQFPDGSVATVDPVEPRDERVGATEGTAMPVAPSIAVLPFENRGDENRDASLVAGLHDGVLSQLGKIPSLESRSRTSVLALPDSSLTTREIAQELDVTHIVEGFVQRDGDDVQIRVALIEAETDRGIWNQTLRRDLTVAGLLDIQEEIALQVASRVGAEVTPGVRQRLNVEAPENFQAYAHYLDGLMDLGFVEGVGERTLTGLQHAARGIDSFSKAIELEPNWAPPRFGAGRVHHFLASSGVDPAANYARSKELLESALAIDPLYGPAWGSLAFVLFRWERDFQGALEAYDRAAALGVESGWGRGLLYAYQGRWDDAVRAYVRAAEENPLSRTIQDQFGWVLFCAGRYEEAAAQSRVANEMRGWDVRETLVLSYAKAGRIDEALAEAARLDDPVSNPGWRAYAFAVLDSAETARRYLEAAVQLRSDENVVNGIASTLVILDGPEEALEYLAEVAADSPGSLGYVDCTEEVRGLRGNARYIALMDELGFPGRGEQLPTARR